MHAPSIRLPRARRRSARAVVVVALLVAGVASAGAASVPDLGDRGWEWPVRPVLIAAPYVAPAHEYGPGHRGIDLRPTVDADVRSPAEGSVAFAGAVAGRGILTIDHGDGLVTTFEPVTTELSAGTAVAKGEVVATMASGGHAEPGTIHFGVRLHGAYLNPMLLLGGVPRAILLPCC